MSKPARPKHSKRWFRRRSKPGTAPGTLTSDPDSPAPEISVMAYGPDKLREVRIQELDEIRQYLGKFPVTWVNVDGLGDVEVVRGIGEIFDLHPLALEDVVNVHQRAKVEEYAQFTFIVARMVELNEHLRTEQVSFFLGHNFVVTFQERPGEDSIAPVRERIRKAHGIVRSAGADYLVYSLLDAVIDGYFPVLEQFGERIENMEDEVSGRNNLQTTSHIQQIKHDLLLIRRALWPHRDALNALIRDPRPCVHDDTRLYLRDCYDHTVQLIDIVETYRELATDLRDLYLSTVSNRMNEIMKVLTIISTIFIPLTFIAGVYGMNFHTDSPWNMPELKWYYGYPLCLLAMGIITVGMLFFFRRKGWIGSQRGKRTENSQR